MKRSRISVLLLLAALCVPAVSLKAATVWNGGSEVTVADLLDGTYWSNGTPTKENPGTITSATVTNSNQFTPAGYQNAAVDLTLGQDSVVNLPSGFVPFKGLSGSGPALFNLTMTDNAQLNVTGNFWGGNNDTGPNSQIEGETYCANLTFGGNSVTTISGEWWVAMSAKSHIIVKDNAQVISNSGNSGIGWGGSSAGSLLELQGGLIQAPSFYIGQSGTNQTFQHTGGELKVTNFVLGSWSADPIPTPNLTRQYYLSGSGSTLTATGNIYNSGLIEIKDGATANVENYTGKGTLTVKDSAAMTVKTYNSVGENESIEAGGTLNVTTFNGQAGNFGINGGTVNIANLNIGNKADASGAVTLASGELNVTNTFLMGNTANGTGTFTQTGGVMNYTGVDNASPRILLSTQAGAKSVMNLSGGSFNITPAAGTFYMADNDDGTAEVNISGTAALSTQEVRVGQHGLATVNMSGGTWTTNGKTFYIGYMDQVAHGVVNLSGTAELTTGNFRPGYTGVGGADTATGELTMSGNSKLTVNGTFYTFDNVQKANSPGLAKMTLSDNAQVYVSGNFWGGTNSNTNYTAPREGEDYAEYFTFGGDSSFSCNEWWVAMSAKTYAVIKDNATVTSRGGNSGLGWGIGSKDSVLDQTGGTLTSPSFYLGNETTSTMNLSGGTANLTVVYGGDKATGVGILNISGTGKLQTTTYALGSAESSDLNMTGGTADITTLNVSNGAGTGTITLNGESAKLNVGSLDLGRNTGSAALTIQNGTLTVSTSANMASNTGAVTVTQSGGKFESTVDVEAARAAGSSITMDLSGGEFITKEFRVATRGNAEMNLSGTANLKTTGAFYPAYNSASSETASATLNMSGDSKLNVNDAFIPFRGNDVSNYSGPGYFNMTLDGNADVYVSGNYWGGSNDEGNYATVPEGKDYALEMVYKGNSKFSCNEWWAAMSAKTHILIADNASVISRGGNSGLAWGIGADNSVLEMTGGTLQAPTFKNGNGDGHPATVLQSGGTSTFNAYENYALSTTELSGTAKMQVQSLKNTGTFTLAGGDLYATAIDTSKTLTVTPSGSLQVGTINPTQAETLTITGSDKLELNGQLVLDVFSQNEIDQINFASGTPIYGSSATLALNLVHPDDFDPFQITTLQISDLGTDALNVRILGRDDLAAWMIGSDAVAFASSSAIPEPATWALLLLGFGLLLKAVPSRKKA